MAGCVARPRGCTSQSNKMGLFVAVGSRVLGMLPLHHLVWLFIPVPSVSKVSLRLFFGV